MKVGYRDMLSKEPKELVQALGLAEGKGPKRPK